MDEAAFVLVPADGSSLAQEFTGVIHVNVI